MPQQEKQSKRDKSAKKSRRNKPSNAGQQMRTERNKRVNTERAATRAAHKKTMRVPRGTARRLRRKAKQLAWKEKHEAQATAQ